MRRCSACRPSRRSSAQPGSVWTRRTGRPASVRPPPLHRPVRWAAVGSGPVRRQPPSDRDRLRLRNFRPTAGGGPWPTERPSQTGPADLEGGVALRVGESLIGCDPEPVAVGDALGPADAPHRDLLFGLCGYGSQIAHASASRFSERRQCIGGLQEHQAHIGRGQPGPGWPRMWPGRAAFADRDALTPEVGNGTDRRVGMH